MKGERYSLRDLEGMDNWRATIRHVVALGSPPRFVCLMKKKDTGYFWKMPDNAHVEDANLDTLREGIATGRLVLVSGKLPPQAKPPVKPTMTAEKRPKKRSKVSV